MITQRGRSGQPFGWTLPVSVCLSVDAAEMPDSTNSMKASVAIEKARCGDTCLIVRNRHSTVATLMLRDIEAAQLGKKVVAISPLGEQTPMEEACILAMEDDSKVPRHAGVTGLSQIYL